MGVGNEAFKEKLEAGVGIYRKRRIKKCTLKLNSQSGVCGRHGHPCCPEVGVA